MIVKLSWHELAMATEIGRLRNLANIKYQRKDSTNQTRYDWHNHLEGACGELAVAKALGRYWDGSVDTFKKPDVCGFQVRTALSHKNLIIRPIDSGEDNFVLVTGNSPVYEIHGWIKGSEGKQDQFWRTDVRSPAWFVPIKYLNPFETLEV